MSQTEDVPFVITKPTIDVLGVLVTIADGSLKPIEKVKVGDRVLSRDYATGKTGGQKVEQVKVHHVKATLVVTLSPGEKIETTKEHPVYVMGESFVPACRLAIGNSNMTCTEVSARGALP